jgi:nucleoside-diphosphate-sugar epimerase
MKRGIVGTFNIASGRETSVNEVSSTLMDLLHIRIEPCLEPDRLGDIRHSYADITKAEKVLNFHPIYSLEKGLAATIDNFHTPQND